MRSIARHAISSAVILESDTNIIRRSTLGIARYLKKRVSFWPKTMKLDSLKPLLSGHYIFNPVACVLYVVLKCVEPFCGWLFPEEECKLSWVS